MGNLLRKHACMAACIISNKAQHAVVGAMLRIVKLIEGLADQFRANIKSFCAGHGEPSLSLLQCVSVEYSLRQMDSISTGLQPYLPDFLSG